ncbi:hypothetical protein ACO2Q3_15880 [Caulobacter sp. KR2-114]|uniref:hypothetical protein n=1 Tax=Caulobacter sp. KR2-114 TaxID=3400912 RepID=UPI003C017F18
MQRLFVSAAIAIAAVAAGAPVCAAPAVAADSAFSAPAFAAQLRSDTGYAALKQKIALSAEAYCRAHPIDGTVASCQRDVTDALVAKAEAQRQALISQQTRLAEARR